MTIIMPVANQLVRLALEEKDEKPVSEISQGVEPMMRFDEMGLKDDLLTGIYDYGLEKPYAIQQLAVPPIISGRDVIAQAQSFAGTTSMIAITACQIVDTNSSEVQVLILSPSWMSAEDTKDKILEFGTNIDIRTHNIDCISEESMYNDKRKLELGNVHVVSGIPCEVLYMINEKALQTRAIKLLILDNSDIMLKRFKDQVYEIYKSIPQKPQVVSISTTLPDEILEATREFVTDPVQILVKRDEFIPEGIKQYFVAVDKEELKFDALCNIYDSFMIPRAVIFCNTEKKVHWLTAKMTQNKRFVTGVFITTDVWVRELDIQLVDLVINYDLPRNRDVYFQRIGWCFERKGVAINLIKNEEFMHLNDIQEYYNTQIDEIHSGKKLQ